MRSKPDAVIYTTANRKTLATIAVHMQANGFNPRSMSEMIRMVIEIYEGLILKHEAEPIESTIEATEILTRMFRASLDARGRFKNNMLENIQEEELASEPTTRAVKPNRTSTKWTESDQRRLMENAERALRNQEILKIFEQHDDTLKGD